MLTVKKSGMKYKDSNGNMQDVGAMVGVETTPVDDTLSLSGYAADAKATGDALSVISDLVDIQAGKVQLTFTSEVQSYKVTFPRVMKGSLSPAVVITIGGGSSWAKQGRANAVSTDTDGFTIHYYCDGGGDGGTVSVSWIAIGRNS